MNHDCGHCKFYKGYIGENPICGHPITAVNNEYPFSEIPTSDCREMNPNSDCQLFSPNINGQMSKDNTKAIIYLIIGLALLSMLMVMK